MKKILALLFCGMFSILIVRLFNLQIVNGQDALEDFTLKIQKERVIEASRGNIYDRNGKVIAYNELAYNVTIEDIFESGKDKNKQINDTIIKVMQILKRNGDKPVGDFNIYLDENTNRIVASQRLLRFMSDREPDYYEGEIEIDEISETTLGELIFFFEYTCALSGYLLNINPFNQPGVEAYKKNMFALLRKPGYEEATEAILKRL